MRRKWYVPFLAVAMTMGATTQRVLAASSQLAEDSVLPEAAGWVADYLKNGLIIALALIIIGGGGLFAYMKMRKH